MRTVRQLLKIIRHEIRAFSDAPKKSVLVLDTDPAAKVLFVVLKEVFKDPEISLSLGDLITKDYDLVCHAAPLTTYVNSFLEQVFDGDGKPLPNVCFPFAHISEEEVKHLAKHYKIKYSVPKDTVGLLDSVSDAKTDVRFSTAKSVDALRKL